MSYSLFVSCPRGLEYLLEQEVRDLGLMVHRVNPHGVYGEANLKCLYQLCLWTRLANRVQLILFSAEIHDQKELYQQCNRYSWDKVFSAEHSVAIEFHGESEYIRNTMFGAQLVKDALVDYFRERYQTRPTIDRQQPQIVIHAHLKKNILTLSFDLNGFSLHQRGYRLSAGMAPLKENVAAALLIRSKWPQYAAQDYAFQDPFCGAGTLVIEAAMMAAHHAPGLLRHDHSFQLWHEHQEHLWNDLRAQALEQIVIPARPLLGTDADPEAIEMAQFNAERAGVSKYVQFTLMDSKNIRAPADKGLLVSNPPYGERLGDGAALLSVYQDLGKALHAHYQNWQAHVITSSPVLAKAIGLRSAKQYTIYNGALECKLYCFDLCNTNQLKECSTIELSEQAKMFANRLEKNYRHLHKWAQRNRISCYRVYDADLPEYAFAIDIYNDYMVLQEYTAPLNVPLHKVQQRRLEVMQLVPDLLQVARDQVVLKQRKPQKGKDQYQKIGQSGRSIIVKEGHGKFIVNLYDYLDTGLFLDHRLLRLKFGTLTPGTKFLNCFCYTASASVHAALAGAITTNVDLSNTYLKWAEENFKLNKLNVSRHQFIQYDCREWLRNTRDRFDVIFLDPPSFSNSKKMLDTLDIQRDHAVLIHSAMRLLNPSGILYFSTNLRQFKMSSAICEQYAVQDMSAQTLDQDFKRNTKIHYCFKIMMPQFA